MYELRAITGHPQIETRAAGDGTTKEYITGTAIVFGQRSQLLGNWFFEQIDARALDDCDMSNVCGLFNHDDNTILGRTQSGTLTLSATPTGLDYSIACDPADPDHVRVMAKIRRGDVRGSSFAFMVAPGGADWDTDPVTGAEVRTVKKIAVLADVSPVVNPAYLQTTSGMGKRSLEAVKAEHDQYIAERRMAGMGKSKENKAADTPYDEQFLNEMVAHHQAGVAMATEAVGKAENDEVKALAASIISAQLTEIDTMQDLLSTLFNVADPDAAEDAKTGERRLSAEHDRMKMELTQ